MKKHINKLFSGILVIGAAAAVTSVLTSCRGGTGGKEKEDPNRYQLYVHNFSGGYGSVWLDNYKQEYEELHKNDKFGTKTGVQIIIDGDKNVIEPSSIPSKNYDIYFGERSQYAYYKYLGYTLDISEALTSENPYDNGKKLEDKLSAQQKAYYGYDDNNDGKLEYYGLPHYSGTFGFMYNRDLFANQGFYYKDGHPEVTTKPSYATCFTRPTSKLAKGPDGAYGTVDDGLPETFDEFYFLCDYIASKDGFKPLIWTGTNAKDYTAALTSCLTASLEGAEQYSMDYSFKGTKQNLVKIEDGKIVKDGSGKPVIESVTLQSDANGVSTNGYEVTRDVARLNALSFLKQILTTEKWQYKDNLNEAFTNTMAQDMFISAGPSRETRIDQTAILIDGTWWQNEAVGTFNKMEQQYGTDGSETALKRDFGYMPFPKANAEDVAHSTYLDILNSLQFAKKTTDETKKALIIDFFQFINSDAALAEFTTTTSVTRSLNYTLSDEDLSKMTLFGRSLYEYKNSPTTTIVYPFDRNNVYTNNQGDFEPVYYYKAIVGTSVDYPCDKLRAGTSAEDYFLASYNFFKSRDYWGK